MRFKVASSVRGLSDVAFREAFGTEEQCRAALLRLRWPDGFVCPCCGHRGHYVLAGRGLYRCNRCKKQTSPTAGTIFHATKLPLTLWFAAIHLIVTAKNGISSVELGRRLGVKQPTAWAVQDHGGNGAARGGDGAIGAGRDGRRLSRRGALRRQAGPRRGGQDTLRGGGLDQSRGAPAQADGRVGGVACRAPPAPSADRRPAGRTRWDSPGPHSAPITPGAPRQFRLALQPALSTRNHDPAFRP